jgi:hypothetical protein
MCIINIFPNRYADPVVKDWTHEDMSGQMLDYTIDELGVAMKEKVVEQDGQVRMCVCVCVCVCVQL